MNRQNAMMSIARENKIVYEIKSTDVVLIQRKRLTLMRADARKNTLRIRNIRICLFTTLSPVNYRSYYAKL